MYHNNENPGETAHLAQPIFGWIGRSLGLVLAAAVGAILAERDRWALWLPAGMASGAGFYYAWATEPAGWMGAGLVMASIAIWLVFRKSPGVLILALALAAPAVGFTAAQVRTQVVAAPVIERELGPVQVQGRIVVAEVRPSDRRLTLADLTIGDLAADETPDRVRVTVRARGGEVAPGDVVTLRAVLLPPSSPAAPGAFDFARYAWFKRLGAVGYAVSAPEIVEGTEPSARGFLASIRHGGSVAAFRHGLSQRINAKLDGQTGAVAAALMTGDRSAINDDVWQALRDAGLAHLLAISGLHVGLMAGILFFALRGILAMIEPLALARPIKKWAAFGAMAGALGYVILTGGTVPTQRAFVMLGLVMLAVMLDRRAFSMRLVAWAAVIVLVTAPEAVLGPSFQMSFAAVVALIATYEIAKEPMRRWRSGAGRGRRALVYLAAVALTTLVAGLATSPFALYHFNRVAAFGLAANLFAVPITSLWIMPWAMVGYVLMPFGLEGLALVPMGWGINGVLWIAETVAGWPGAAHNLPDMPTFGIVMVALGGLWLCLWRTPWRIWGVAGIGAGIMTTGMC
ncbi:MAG: ComEC family competence protein [Alphaproteobacteria bacterium]|nr:ComEC family competence protein [Alphaproteobacteria bacterium]